MATNVQYVPGVCNLGKAEIAKRKSFGWGGLIVTLILWALFSYQGLASGWYLLLFIPAFLSAIGLLQGFMHFCVAFGMKGVFNVSPELQKLENVSQAEFRAQDKKKAVQIFAYALLIAAAVTILAYFVH
jgi:ABC-type tungstate transport system substrate-binding protein